MVVLVVVYTYSVLIVMVPEARLADFKVSFMESTKLNGFVLGIAMLFSFMMYGLQKFLW